MIFFRWISAFLLLMIFIGLLFKMSATLSIFLLIIAVCVFVLDLLQSNKKAFK
ncbi:hypothetical protein ACER0A_011565 [Haloimpatiens sp. FM7315]|uniref:hypothetical protein n=1 Tax=Haloimpatiens sp. FM7315 TaxID=3298609 RepID=UPI00370AFA78